MVDHLEQLDIADPELGRDIRAVLEQGASDISDDHKTWLVEQTFWGLEQELSLGHAVGLGCAALMAAGSDETVKGYMAEVRRAHKKGPTLARILAIHLVPVHRHQDPNLSARFRKTVAIMLQKGVYTLRSPLGAASELLDGGDVKCARSYLALLQDIFGQELTYNRCLLLTRMIPHAVMGLAPRSRAFQIRSIRRVATTDLDLLDPFLNSLANGLGLLDEKGLGRFVAHALAEFDHSRIKGKKFLSLESQTGQNTMNSLRVTVPLARVRSRLMGYLHARTGLPLIIRPLSALSTTVYTSSVNGPTVLSDGKCLYLPDEIDLFPEPAANSDLYRHLVGFEAGGVEFGSFDFDLERYRQDHPGWPGGERNSKDKTSDLEIFWSGFSMPTLAADLFTIFEHARIWQLLGRQYPGLVRKALPVFQTEAKRISTCGNLLGIMYVRITLNTQLATHEKVPGQWLDFITATVHMMNEAFQGQPVVETCAGITVAVYNRCKALLKELDPQGLQEMQTPFGLRIRPDAFHMAHAKNEQIARRLKSALQKSGYHIYKSDIHIHLRKNNGRLMCDALEEMIRPMDQIGKGPEAQDSAFPPAEQKFFLESLDLGQHFESTPGVTPMDLDAEGQVFWYREWDHELGDYLHRHVRLLERRLPETENGFYMQTLKRRSGLVGQIRRAFELLRPEGMKLLRQWVEGDAFDYRALIDFAVDKKAGRTPSERLYIKRIKQFRDVAVMLLVDLSRSTANPVYGSEATVMDVQKEAIVLFCEALETLGDTYSVVGFSGNGRLGADYYRIKDFAEDLEDPVRRRINAMAPLRNTRMGAAIRHATTDLEQTAARVRLMIVLGDGFPNDLDYKHAHAIEDTHRAILEARSRGIHTHGITVNIAADPKLDQLFGFARHNVIGDVKELPSKLVRIYHALTR
jgi:nitric oxide reductase NorD protein